MLWVVLAPRSPFHGKTLAYYPRRSTPRNDEKVSYGNEPLDDDSEFLVGFKRWKMENTLERLRRTFKTQSFWWFGILRLQMF
jgi:hypothetical protein